MSTYLWSLIFCFKGLNICPGVMVNGSGHLWNCRITIKMQWDLTLLAFTYFTMCWCCNWLFGGLIQIVESVNDLAQIMKDLSVLVIDQVCLDFISVLLISSLCYIPSCSFVFHICPTQHFTLNVQLELIHIQIFVSVILCTGNNSWSYWLQYYKCCCFSGARSERAG